MLEGRIDNRLWESLEHSWTSRHYKSAIMDAIQFFGDLIRDRTGLDSDGATLAGEAFGGDKPKLKVNALSTPSEQNEQAGLQDIIRGIYRAIRNPRSHERRTDSAEEAEAIILFLNYLVGIIDRSQTQFVTEAFLKRVFDDAFVKDVHYAQLLLSEIPVRKRLDVFRRAYAAKEEGDISTLRYFFHVLFNALSNDEQQIVCSLVSDEIKGQANASTIISVLGTMPVSCWQRYSEVARLRAEHMILRSIKDGAYDVQREDCLDGVLGTWGHRVAKYFINKSDLIKLLFLKITGINDYSRDYALKYYLDWLVASAVPFPDEVVAALKSTLNEDENAAKDVLSGLLDNDYIKNTFGRVLHDSVGEHEADDDIPF